MFSDVLGQEGAHLHLTRGGEAVHAIDVNPTVGRLQKACVVEVAFLVFAVELEPFGVV